jgi:general secretion pathway protein K
VALAIVMWFVAGMSLLVAGIVLSARTDVRLAQVHYARAQIAAAGDGAINLFLADLLDARSRGGREPGGRGGISQRRYRVGDDMVSVLAVPGSAFFDVSGASAEELARVAEASGAVAAGGGTAVARAVVQYRDDPDRRPYGRLESPEDLLGVAGINRSMLDALRDYISVGGARGRGAGDLEQSLRLLRSVAPAARARDNDLNASLAGDAASRVQSSGSYRVDALVRRGQDVWLRRRWIDLGRGAAGLPWSSSRIEPVRIVPRPI